MEKLLYPQPAFDERIPLSELQLRHERIRKYLNQYAPDACGILIFGDTDIYYASGTCSGGAMWLPVEGDPVLFVRKGLGRTKVESAIEAQLPYRSYSEFMPLAAGAGSPIPEKGQVAVNMSKLSWASARLLSSKMPSLGFVPGDMAIRRARAVKTELEIAKMRRCGRVHEACFKALPSLIRPGMSEWDISEALHGLYAEQGDSRLAKLSAPGRVSLGSVSAGDSGLYPLSFDGPLGLRGSHPASPAAGSRSTVWRSGQILTVDVPCAIEGYVSDKTVTFFAGKNIPEDIRLACQACKEIHDEVADRMRVGALPSDLWKHAQKMAAERGFADSFMGLGSERCRFVGHGIGLEMDEYPAVAAKFDTPLEYGMTIALEPKIGIPGTAMVGIENTFLVSDGPAESLSGQGEALVALD